MLIGTFVGGSIFQHPIEALLHPLTEIKIISLRITSTEKATRLLPGASCCDAMIHHFTINSHELSDCWVCGPIVFSTYIRTSLKILCGMSGHPSLQISSHSSMGCARGGVHDPHPSFTPLLVSTRCPTSTHPLHSM